MKQTKYIYTKVIQQNFGTWEDVSEYECSSQGLPSEQSGKFKTLASGRQVPISLFSHDLQEYKLMAYPTRTVTRKTLRP